MTLSRKSPRVVALAVAVLSVGCGDDEGTGGTGGSGGAPACVELADGRCVEETFQNPPLLEPNADGVYELTLQPTEITLDGQRHCGRAYNGLYPAPTIDTRTSAEPRQVRVDLRNAFTKSDYRALSQGACTCVDSETGESCTPSAHGHGGSCQCTTEDGNTCHMFDFNVTNLHAHGSHVRPDYAAGGGCVEEDGLSCRGCEADASAEPRECFFADDVISRVEPGEGVRHRWDIDEDGLHHAGLNWYHPHIHGSTAIQVASGATGAWIVRGALDEIPGIKDARERILLITTPPTSYEPLAEGEPCDEDHITFNDFAVLGDTDAKQTNLINGVRRPRMLMPPGQIERWRLLHGAFLDEITLAVFRGLDADCADLDLTAPPLALTQIGRDGVPMAQPESGEGWPFAPPYVFMAPGYRVEALLDGSQLAHGDTLCLMSGRFLQEDTTDPTGDALTPEEILQVASNGDLVAIVNVTSAAGTPTETQMPDLDAVAAESPTMMLQGGAVDALARCEEAAAISEPSEIEQLSFMWPIFTNQEGFDDCACPDHNLNCKNFETTDRDKYPYDRVLTVGDVDHWRLMSGFDGHPFHIHINPFVVCPVPEDGPTAKSRLFEPPFAHWRDTYLVNFDRMVDVVTEYRSYAGSYVYHCHKLTHEDHGMMELIRVCDPAVDECDTLCSGGECGWRACAPGDDDCVRALTATDCLVDPTVCPEALLRCTTCDEAMSCPPEAHCSAVVHVDGEQRCVPGCLADADCPLTDACDALGECVPAPCSPPCGPPAMCEHGVCVP
jgi:L-ascorbate oxidase